MDGGLVFIVIGGAVLCWWWLRPKREKAAALLDLVFAENEREWGRLKAVAKRCGLTIDAGDDRLWRGGYLLMSDEDRVQFKMVTAQMVHGVPLPGMKESARSFFAYLRAHGLRPRDCRHYFDEIGMPDVRKMPSEAQIRRESLRD